MWVGMPVRTLKGNSKLSHASHMQASCSVVTCLLVPPLCSDSTAGRSANSRLGFSYVAGWPLGQRAKARAYLMSRAEVFKGRPFAARAERTLTILSSFI